MNRHISHFICIIFGTLAHLEPETSSKACPTCKIIRQIQSPGIVRTVYSNILKCLFKLKFIQKSATAYSGIFRTLFNAYSEPCHIQNSVKIRILAYTGPETYSESCLFRHIQAYSIMIVTITLAFFFSLSISHTYYSELCQSILWDIQNAVQRLHI